MMAMETHQFRTIGLIALGSVLGIAITIGVLLSFNTSVSESSKKSVAVNSTAVDANSAREELRESSLMVTHDRKTDLGHFNFLNLAPSAFARTEALYSLLHSADEEFLTTLLQQSVHISSEALQHITQIAIVQRFTVLDPQLTLAAIDDLPSHRHKSLIYSVFNEWALIEVDAAITHAKILEESKKLVALQGIFGSQENLSISRKEEIARQLEIDLSEFEELTIFSNSIAKEWEYLLNDELSNVAQTTQLIQLAQQWVDQFGLEAMTQIEKTLNDPNLKQVVMGAVLQRALLADSDATLQQALGLEGELREHVLETIAGAWASISPHAAMESISAIESHRDRRQMLDHFVTTWANFDPQGMFENFNLVPENLREYAEENAIRAIAKTTPELAVQYLTNVSNEFLKFDLTMEIATSWSDQNTVAALDWALAHEFSNSGLKNLVLDMVLSRVAAENPSLALQTALDQPTNMMGLGFEATVVEEVAQTDLELAIAMLPQVRDGFTKSSSYVAVGKALIRNGETDRALEFAQQLPEESRDLYYSLLANQWAYSDPKSLVPMLDELPSTEAQYTAAMDLTRLNVGTNVLTKEQMSVVRSFLPKDYNSETGRSGAESARFARLNSMQDKDLTEAERTQIQKDFQKVMLEGRYRIYRLPSP